MDIKVIPELPQLLTHSVGFLITFLVLKKYAWGPLLGLMEERRNRISEEFETIEQEKAKAAELTAEYEGKLKDIDTERRAKLVELVNEGKKIAEDLKTSAREEAKEIQVKAKGELDRDVAKAKVQLKNDMVSMTMTAAEKIINERLDDQKHRELIGKYIDGLEKV
jgi:F-type H+-transporting ATPase subunit b